MTDISTDLGILWPALIAGSWSSISHVPLGQQVLRRGIVFIDLAIAQVAGARRHRGAFRRARARRGGRRRSPPVAAALLGALLLTWTERKRPEVQEALIGILFVLASTAQILLLANDPHGGEEPQRPARRADPVGVDAATDPCGDTDRPSSCSSGSRWREHIGRIGFYVLFAVMVTVSVQLVGVYLVFTSLIVPAVATYRHATKRQLTIGYGLAIASYLAGLAASVLTDLPSSAVIVWAMAVLAIMLHLTGRRGRAVDLEEG